MSNMNTEKMFYSVALGLLVGWALAQPVIALKNAYLDYSQARAERAEEARRIAREQEIERTCEWVDVAGGNPNGLSWIGVELRAKPGVSREQGFKICGKTAFNRGREVYVVSKQSTAMGRNARAVNRTD